MRTGPNYFKLSKQDKVDALETAAYTLGRPSDLLEKDIWVVWVLNALFSSKFGDHLVFKLPRSSRGRVPRAACAPPAPRRRR